MLLNDKIAVVRFLFANVALCCGILRSTMNLEIWNIPFHNSLVVDMLNLKPSNGHPETLNISAMCDEWKNQHAQLDPGDTLSTLLEIELNTSLHSAADFLFHAFGAWLVENEAMSSKDRISMLFRYSAQGNHSGFQAAPLHGAVWHIVIVQLRLSKNVGCFQCAKKAFRETLSRMCSQDGATYNQIGSCWHGAGHGALMSSLIQASHLKYDACSPLRLYAKDFRQNVSSNMLSSAIDLCESATFDYYLFACVSGIYHSFFKMTMKPQRTDDDWVQPCDTVRRYALACFMFRIANYDEGAAAGWRMISPTRCFSYEMRAEVNMLGCIYQTSKTVVEAGNQRLLSGAASISICEECFVLANRGPSEGASFRLDPQLSKVACLSPFVLESVRPVAGSYRKQVWAYMEQLSHRLVGPDEQ